MLIFSFSLLSRHQALNRTPKYKQLLVKSPKAHLSTTIFEKLMHTAPKKPSSSVPKTANMTGGIFETDLIYCTAMLQFYPFQVEYAFTQPYSSALEQMDWNLRQRRCWNDFLGGLKSSNIFFHCVELHIWIIVCFYFLIDV